MLPGRPASEVLDEWVSHFKTLSCIPWIGNFSTLRSPITISSRNTPSFSPLQIDTSLNRSRTLKPRQTVIGAWEICSLSMTGRIISEVMSSRRHGGSGTRRSKLWRGGRKILSLIMKVRPESCVLRRGWNSLIAGLRVIRPCSHSRIILAGW